MACRKCRKRKRNMDVSPKRPARGSIRKAKRQEMRRKKKEKMRDEVQSEPTAPSSSSEEPHELGVELSRGKTISESVMSVIEFDVKPV
jgi:hypothetical protein